MSCRGYSCIVKRAYINVTTANDLWLIALHSLLRHLISWRMHATQTKLGLPNWWCGKIQQTQSTCIRFVLSVWWEFVYNLRFHAKRLQNIYTNTPESHQNREIFKVTSWLFFGGLWEKRTAGTMVSGARRVVAIRAADHFIKRFKVDAENWTCANWIWTNTTIFYLLLFV